MGTPTRADQNTARRQALDPSGWGTRPGDDHFFDHFFAAPSCGEATKTAERELAFAGYTDYFLWFEQARFGTALRRKAAQGCRVRCLVGDPGSELTRSRERDEDVPLALSTRIRVTLAELEKIRHQPGVGARYSAPATPRQRNVGVARRRDAPRRVAAGVRRPGDP
ncbi:hypothetical protein [Streptomyces alkaliterrae]|uniref:hypothetical protein n=1 Tax=Streptomyces alkaliterrae TaxID=2213162 RepID=UPI001E31A841|nr:hypothetical protein [Streptomyces alkaliterrae]